MQLAKGPIIHFMDDDDIAAPRLLEEHLETHSKYPDENVAVLGFTDLREDIAFLPLMHFVTEVGNYLFGYSKLKHGQTLDYKYFWGGRTSCKKDFLLKYGLFDPIFKFGCEDIELGYRLSKYGLKVVYNKNARTTMIRSFSLEQFCKRSERQGYSNWLFREKHPTPEIIAWTETADMETRWETVRASLSRYKKSACDLEKIVLARLKYGIEVDQSIMALLHNAYWKVIDGFRIQGTWNARNIMNINHSGQPLPSPINYEFYFSTLMQVLQLAKDAHLPPALAEINKSRGFDSTARVIALQEWIAAREQDTPNFNSLEFLEKFLEKYSNEIAALITAALEYRKFGDRQHALSKINEALSLMRFDLYANRVAVSIFAWANNNPQDDTEIWLKGRYCYLPFENIDVMPDGNVFLCCGDWLPIPIGNIYRDTAEGIWNSPIAQEIRSSIIDGSFSYCSRMSCMEILNKKLPPKIHANRTSIAGVTKPPKRVVLSHDNSCNLACPSCRTEVFMANKESQEQLNIILEKVFVPILHEADTVRISGSGDPFASYHYRTLLKRINHKEFPKLKVDIHTNGQLFNEKAWNDLELSGKVSNVEISIDAATAETYKIVRYPGDFNRLLRNLEFIRQLRERNEIKSLCFSFVVQLLNYREMPQFVLLAEKYRADVVDFRNILNWGTSSLETYNKNFIGSPAHPEHGKLLEVLKFHELHRFNVRLPFN